MPRKPIPTSRRTRLDGHWTPTELAGAWTCAEAMVNGHWDVLVSDTFRCPVLLEELLAAFLLSRPELIDAKPGVIDIKFHVFRRKCLNSWISWESRCRDVPTTALWYVGTMVHELTNQKYPLFEHLHRSRQIKAARKLIHERSKAERNS